MTYFEKNDDKVNLNREMMVYFAVYKNVIGNIETIETDVNALKADYYGTADMASSIAKITLTVHTHNDYLSLLFSILIIKIFFLTVIFFVKI